MTWRDRWKWLKWSLHYWHCADCRAWRADYLQDVRDGHYWTVDELNRLRDHI